MANRCLVATVRTISNRAKYNSWYNQGNARTCIGLTEDDKTLVLFTVDDAGGSNGMTVGEAANYMVSDLGVYNAAEP